MNKLNHKFEFLHQKILLHDEKNYIKLLSFALLTTSFSNNLNSLTDSTITGLSVAGGGIAGVIASGAMYSSMARIDGINLRSNLISLSVGAGVGGITGLLLHWSLYPFSAKARIFGASKIIHVVEQKDLAKNTFQSDENLFAHATARYNIRWPIAEAHEATLSLLEQLNCAIRYLENATQDTQDPLLLTEITKLYAKIDPLSKILQKHAATFQTHKQYEIQAVLLEGFRREQRIEQQAEQRHQEAMRQQRLAMAQQQKLHQEAMDQQRASNHR